jgi:hypothetical protein
MTDRISNHREVADAKVRKLFPRLFLSMALLLISIIFVPDEYSVLPLAFSVVACWLSGKAIDVEMARIKAYNESIDAILLEWTLSLDSILAMLSSVLPPVEPDREINNDG